MSTETDLFSEASIKKLHDLYCEKTSYDVEFNFTRLRQWYEWLKWRTTPFTADDLLRVIGHIKQGIHKDERREGALKFTNLIGNPDRFEEDLSLALGAMKERKQAAGSKGNYVPVTPPPISERATPEVFAEFARRLGKKARIG